MSVRNESEDRVVRHSKRTVEFAEVVDLIAGTTLDSEPRGRAEQVHAAATRWRHDWNLLFVH